jgi:hypothetical protein
MVDPGVYAKPIPFGGMGKPVNQNGFSDHFPITMTVTEVQEHDGRYPALEAKGAEAFAVLHRSVLEEN